jgi:hypothetical protein
VLAERLQVEVASQINPIFTVGYSLLTDYVAACRNRLLQN